MKKSKIIASVCTLILTLACLTFGVYSAVKTSFTASGTITFNAYDIRCDVKCTISGTTDNNRTIYGTTFQDGTARENYTSSTGLLSGVVDLSASNAKFELGDFAFDELNENNLITIKFTITNYSNYAIEATATIGEISTLDITNSPITYCYAAENNGTVIDSRELVLTFAPKAGSAAFIENLNMSINITPSSKTITTEGFTTSVSGDKVTITGYTGSDVDVVIPRTIDGKIVTSIGIGAFSSEDFENCLNITSITIPSSVTSIGDAAFQFCSNLTTITIPNSVTSIGYGAFGDCENLTSITIPNSVTSIGPEAFSNCSNLSSITIPEGVTSIGSDAFKNCSNLSSITIPNSVTSIGSDAFKNCSNLSSITVESGNTKYDSRDNCNAIIEKSSNTLISGCQNTVIPDSVTSIGNSAFYGCSNLSSITIPNSVTSIGNYAFSGCRGLASITIPNSVTSIGNYAFSGCRGLASITIPESVTSIGLRAFNACDSLTRITCNSASVGTNYIGLSMYFKANDSDTLPTSTVGAWQAGAGVYTKTKPTA